MRGVAISAIFIRELLCLLTHHGVELDNKAFAAGAIPHPEFPGGIGLLHGEEGPSGFGVAHIEEGHPGYIAEAVRTLPNMPVIETTASGRKVLFDGRNRAVVSSNLKGYRTPDWLLTAYEQSAPAASSSVSGAPVESAGPTYPATDRSTSLTPKSVTAPPGFAPGDALRARMAEAVEPSGEVAPEHPVIGRNRQGAADRWANNLKALDMPAPALGDDAAWSRLSQQMGERKGYTPSANTRQMIHERLGQAAPLSELERQLQDSIAAVERAKQLESGGNGNAAATPAAGDGPAGTREAIPQPISTDRGIAAAPAASRTSVDVPGEARSYKARYEVRELADLQPSHNGETFQRNPHYAIENDRNYDDAVNQRKIVDWSVEGPTGFKPRNLLNTAPDSSIGPPVIDSEGNVIGGNGRTMTMQRVYKSNPAGASRYRAELDRTARHYGIDPESYAGMKQPVLVRTIDDAEFEQAGAKQRAVTDFNKVGTAALTPAERAIADSKNVSTATLDDIAARMDRHGPDATLAQVLEGRAGVDVLRNLTKDGVISPQEQAALASESSLTKAGKERISGLMTGRFFNNARQLDTLPDSLRGKMERLAAPLARVEGSPEYSLSPHIRQALDLIEDAGAHGAATLDDHLAQLGFFAEKQYSPEAVALAKQLKSRDPVALTNAVRAYAEAAKYAADYQGPGMLNEFPDPLKPGAAFEESFGAKALEDEAKAKSAKRDAAAAAKAATGEEKLAKAKADFAAKKKRAK